MYRHCQLLLASTLLNWFLIEKGHLYVALVLDFLWILAISCKVLIFCSDVGGGHGLSLKSKWIVFGVVREGSRPPSIQTFLQFVTFAWIPTMSSMSAAYGENTRSDRSRSGAAAREFLLCWCSDQGSVVRGSPWACWISNVVSSLVIWSISAYSRSCCLTLLVNNLDADVSVEYLHTVFGRYSCVKKVRGHCLEHTSLLNITIRVMQRKKW